MKVGSNITIWITGMIGTYTAEVVGLDDNARPILKVTSEEGWPTLKDGDYIIREGHYESETIGSNFD